MGGYFCCFARLPSHSGVDIISALGAGRSVGGSAEPAVGNATGIAAKAPVWIGPAVRTPVAENHLHCNHSSESFPLTWGLSSRSGPGNIRQDWAGLSGLGGQLGRGCCRRPQKHRLKRPNGQMPLRTAQCSCQSRLVRQGFQRWPSRSQSSHPGMSPHCQRDLPP